MIRRGEVWWADLEDPVGSAPGFRRPVLVVQSDAFNRSLIGTVITVPLTSNLRLADAPGNVFISRDLSGLSRDSVANVSQVVTIDRTGLTERASAGLLPPDIIRLVDRGLRTSLDL